MLQELIGKVRRGAGDGLPGGRVPESMVSDPTFSRNCFFVPSFVIFLGGSLAFIMGVRAGAPMCVPDSIYKSPVVYRGYGGSIPGTVFRICREHNFRCPTRGYRRGFVLFLVGKRVLIGDQRCTKAVLGTKRFVLRPVDSGVRVLTVASIRYVCCRFGRPRLFYSVQCGHVVGRASPPLVPSPLPVVPRLRRFLRSTHACLDRGGVYQSLLSLGQGRLTFVLNCFCSSCSLTSLMRPLSGCTSSFRYFMCRGCGGIGAIRRFTGLKKCDRAAFEEVFSGIFRRPICR